MTDEKKPGSGTDDASEWDDALAEWDNQAFSPEVAKDTSTQKPAVLPTVSKPLYRPPSPPAKPTASVAASPPVLPSRLPSRVPSVPGRVPPRPAPGARPPPLPPPLPAQAPTEEEDSSTTLVTSVPEELRRGIEASPRSSRGGLSQLFARDDARDGNKEASIDVSLDEPSSTVIVAPSDRPTADVSAPSEPAVRAESAPGEPAGSLDAPVEPVLPVPEEEPPFNPFADFEPPRSAQATRPAEDEIDDLLNSAPPPPASSKVDTWVPPPDPEQVEVPRIPAAMGLPLLIPEERQYDPNEETRTTAGLAREAMAVTAQPAARGGASAEPRIWTDEKPASAWLGDEARAAFAARAEWLEQEARLLTDKVARARGLLVCSEILATIGEREQAQALAAEARDMAPSLALAHRQARGLMLAPPDPEEYLEALDAEIKITPAGPARVHGMLLAVEALRASGDDEGSAKRLDQLARVAGGDARPTIARAVRALWRNEVASPALRLPEGDLTQVSDALHTALRLRGLERKDSTSSDGERSPNEFLVQARAALDRGDVAGAAPLLAQLTSVAELAPAVRWLAASLQATTEATRPEAARLLRELVRRGDAEARSVLLLRAIELEDSETLDLAVREPGPLGAAERMTLAALAGLEIDPSDPQLDVTAETPGMSALAAAITALSRITAEGDARTGQLHARAHRVAGSAQSRAQVTLGRWLATSATATEIVGALVAFGEHPPPSARALALEMDSRAGRALEVSRALETWGSTRETTEDRTAGALAAALVAERAGETARATAAFQAARAADPTNEAALRALASIHSIDLVTELNTLAEELGDGVRGAIARIEAISRGSDMLPEPTRVDLLERAHRAAPTLPIAAFLAERIARSGGNVDEMLRWVRERRASTADAVEAGLDAVREALLLADRDRDLAGERLHEAQRARPSDVALRELYERMTPEAPEDRAAWREQRAADAVGDARALLFLDAAREYERSGDDEGALRCAEAASATDSALARVVRERTELGGSKVSRLADELLTLAKATEDAGVRREAYERLAVLDATARQDPASALLWHRSILEEQPGYLPSLRYVEQHLIGEGRDEELEPIASGIAFALKGKGSVEASAHAELAARLRLRGPEGSWESTRELVQLASAETPPTLWSLRMLEAHSRATGDDETFLSVLMKLIERTTRPVETAALLIHAGEAAARLGRLDEAKALLQRAAVEDPGDVVAWGLLAEVRQRAGDARGAAEACEALARSSVVPEHQLLAWYDAGRIWQDDALEEDRAIVALESAAALDPSYAEIFDRLSRLYAARKMQPELAALLERRLEGVTDAEERLVLEVRRGQILLEVGDPAGARSAFEAALAQRPDDAGALSAYADLCVAQRDWDAAEQALVRLARLLPTPDEQRDVYARLGELYSKHLVNLARAEVAFKEVLRRAPDDAPMTEKLIDVYRRQNDSARAVELQQELVTKAKTQDEKRARLVALATIYENVGHDNRKAEQTLEVARREFPQDVVVLRALAEFYTRHQQTPAVNILLDRAGSDARRGLAAGRFSTALFELLATVFELRGKKDAARVAQAMLAALEGRPSELRGAAERAFDPRLDDLLAPEVLSPAMRTLLFKTGHALDAAVPFDARGQRATTLSHDTPIARIVATASQALGLGSVQVLVSPRLGVACLPCSSAPPVIVVGEALATQERLAGFLVLRALKLVQARASALARMPAAELPVLVSAWLKCFNPTWQPQGVNAAAVNAMGGKIQAALPRHVEPDVGVVALEVAGTLGTQAASLGVQALNWGNRTTLLALGDATGLLDAIAVAGGLPGGAPRDPKERAAWIQRTAEARDTIAFGVSDAFADARMRTGVDR